MIEYDYIIVGGGPCGMTMALYLSSVNKRCLIIDDRELGGCHRVDRTHDNLFSEHGPRIYSSAYKNTREILRLINTSWDETFVPYKFNISSIGNETIKSFSIREKITLILYFIVYICGYEFKTKSVYDMVKSFSSSSIDYIDRLCRLTDGADISRYSFYQFLQLVNENAFERVYQPKHPTDKHLFKLWKTKLESNGVDILTDKVYDIDTDNKMIMNTFKYKKLVLCIPPLNLFNLLEKNLKLYKSWCNINKMDLYEWTIKSSYNTYIPITFHWHQKITLSKIWGFPKDDWGIAFIVLSDYMTDIETEYNFVISTCITKIDAKSSILGKSPLEIKDTNILINEVFRQLKISFPELPNYDRAILNTKIDNAFVKTYDTKFIDIDVYEDIYCVGTFNGHSPYSFTSMESAVSNAIYAVNVLENLNIPIRKSLTLALVIRIVAIVIIVLLILALLKAR